jgi:hypothetical protein
MDMPHRVGKLLLDVLTLVGFQELLIFVDVARDNIKVETLRRLGLAIHEHRERLRRRVTQPFFDRQPVAL